MERNRNRTFHRTIDEGHASIHIYRQSDDRTPNHSFSQIEVQSIKPPLNQLQPVLTVSQLTAQIKGLLETDFDHIFVVGEVSNAKVHPSGHWYFSLKDKDATLPCVCFKNSNSSVKFKLEDGLMLVARGRISVFAPRGSYQMVVNTLEPVGVGEWQLAFEQLRAQLESEGLFDPLRKRPIPILPKAIGVVTSPSGAALKDILSALHRRNRHVSVVISPARVQGEGSAEEIARAINDLQHIEGIDVILVARGGGSIEDLWSFNTELVARAVAESKIPVISGVGHESDVTICDLAADLRAPTPTAAAELVARGRAELLDKWSFLNNQLLSRTDTRLTAYRAQLLRLNPNHALLRYQERLKRNQLKVKHCRESIMFSITHSLSKAKHRLTQNHEKLLALGPKNVLNRGFAIIRSEDGNIVRDTASLTVGDRLVATLSNGRAILKVESIETGEMEDGAST